jgi:hypothetical protein
LVTERNYGVFKLSGQGKQRTMTIQCKSTTGAVLWSHALDLEALGWEKV